MGQYQRTRIVLVILAIFMLSLGLLVGAGKAMIFYKQSVSQKAVVRGVESITEASMAIAEALSYETSNAVREKYDVFCNLVIESDVPSYKESEIEDYYRRGIVNSLKERVGTKEALREYLTGKLPTPPYGKITLDDACSPYFYIEEGSDGSIVSASVRGVVLKYESLPGITRSESVRYDIEFPQVTFYAGNEDAFDYCMMSGKGIYIQGATSSFVGNVYAGEHAATESRDIEISYGEVASYGGINVLGTQLGIAADVVASEADMNLSGSFVIIAPQDNGELNCYMRQLRKMRGYNSESMCSIEGNVYDVRQLPEQHLNEYLRISKMAKTTLSSLCDIPYYYDSNNDSYYEGEYRKIISSQDVEIDEDITGIIMTPANVIIGPGCNVEGLILCGDRIYLQGNNNIVSNETVIKKILSDEIAETNSLGSDDAASSEAEADMQRSEVYYHALDYIGGLAYPGIVYPDYYVIPYQE